MLSRLCSARLLSISLSPRLLSPSAGPRRALWGWSERVLLARGSELAHLPSRATEKAERSIVDRLRVLFRSRSPRNSGGASGEPPTSRPSSSRKGFLHGSEEQPREHDKKGQGPEPEPEPEPRGPPKWTEILLPLFGIAALQLFISWKSDSVEISFQDFCRTILPTGEVASLQVDVGTDQVYVEFHRGADVPGIPNARAKVVYFSIASEDVFERQLQEAVDALGIDEVDPIPITYTRGLPISEIVLAALPTLVTIGVFVALVRRAGKQMGMDSSGRGGLSPFTMGQMKGATPVVSKTRFSDVAGLTEAKMEVQELVQYLNDPTAIGQLGGRVPKGALLVGPPGTGKTLLAKALAGEAGVPFMAVSGSDFVEMFVGVGPSRVRNLFEQGRLHAPCVLFIDEIDAVGRARFGRQGNSERENTLNQLLVEMDGFVPSSGLLVLASTNRVDVLDKALLRPGRFDRQVACDLPTLPERRDIAKLYLQRIKLSGKPADHVERLAAMTAGLSGAQISAICNEAALKAARENRDGVTAEDLDFAVARVVSGIEKPSLVLQPQERRMVAAHEAGHALAGWMLQHTERVLKVSIIPRAKAALGFTQSMPSDQKLHSREDLADRMCMLLAGRAAEQLLCDVTSTGAQDDLKRVTELAYRVVCRFGMSDKVGPVALQYPIPASEGKKRISDHAARTLDFEADQLVRTAYHRACALMAEHRAKLETLVQRLLEKESIGEEDLREVLGPRPAEASV